MLDAWAKINSGRWRNTRIDTSEAISRYRRLNDHLPEFFLFHVDGGEISLVPKRDHPTTADWLQVRIRAYMRFLRDCLASGHFAARDLLIPIVLGDFAVDGEAGPIFCFQKRFSSDALLINDIDFLDQGFFEEDVYRDRLEYPEKRDRAVFIGSTTGSTHDVESVKSLKNPRIAAAIAFKDDPRVDFRLPNIVQCRDRQAEDLLRSMGFGSGGWASWQDQFASKFIISMDGNGATCSRVAVTLRSNSVLLKYDSPNLLYYFPTMLPWMHYIPIHSHDDVARVVEAERSQPGLHRDIAEAGRTYAETFLTRDMGVRYGAMMLTMFARAFDR